MSLGLLVDAPVGCEPELINVSADDMRHLPICSGEGILLVLIATHCDNVVERNANLRVEHLPLFNKAVGAYSFQ